MSEGSVTGEREVPRLNAEWHNANPMPKRPTLEQRIAWHIEHQKNCSCRPVPAGLRDELRKRGVEVL
jgi:hypothetical protein